MKRFTSLLISCSLALAGAAIAQQPEQQESPAKKKGAAKTHAAEAKPQETAAKQRAPSKGEKAEVRPKSETATAASATPGAKQQVGRTKGMKAPAAGAKASPGATTATGAATAATSPTSPPKARAGAGAAAKKPAPQQVQQIKAQHATFRAQPKPEQVPSVTFNQTYRIQGSEQWQGPQYEVFRAYHPEWHDAGWYRSRYSRVELIGGGYYYWNNGYWYPAWGYDPSAQYYAYDAPIYVGHRAEPPDRVIADVQAELQQMGYYRGEVDGLLGPLTREALTAYQSDQGLTATAVIDQPTLESLGLA